MPPSLRRLLALLLSVLLIRIDSPVADWRFSPSPRGQSPFAEEALTPIVRAALFRPRRLQPAGAWVVTMSLLSASADPLLAQARVRHIAERSPLPRESTPENLEADVRALVREADRAHIMEALDYRFASDVSLIPGYEDGQQIAAKKRTSAAMPVLAKILQNPDLSAPERLRAGWVLLALNPDEAMKAAEKALRHADVVEWRVALDRLLDASRLFRTLDEIPVRFPQQPTFHEEIVDPLVALRGEDVIDVLVERLHWRGVWAVEECEVLARIGGPYVTQRLLSILQKATSGKETLAIAADVLGVLGAEEARRPLRDRLLEPHRDGYSPEFPQRLARALVRLQDREFIGELIRAIQDKSAKRQDRQEWIRALGAAQDPSALPALARLFKNRATERVVRLQAGQALRRFGDPRLVPDLISVMMDDRSDAFIRAAAAEALGALPMTSKSLQALMKAFLFTAPMRPDDGGVSVRDSVREKAAEAVSEFGEAAVPALLQALTSEEPFLRAEAIHALEQNVGDDAAHSGKGAFLGFLLERLAAQGPADPSLRELHHLYQQARGAGILMPYRFSLPTLRQLLSQPPHADDKRPLALLVYAEDDWDHAFYMRDQNPVQDLLDAGYRVVYKTVPGRREFVETLNTMAALEPASVLILGAHGTDKGIDFRDFRRNASLELEDESYLRASGISSVLAPGGQIVVFSCNSGKGGASAPNFANMLRRVFPQAAPHGIWTSTEISALDRLVFDGRGRLKKALFSPADALYLADAGPSPRQGDPLAIAPHYWWGELYHAALEGQESVRAYVKKLKRAEMNWMRIRLTYPWLYAELLKKKAQPYDLDKLKRLIESLVAPSEETHDFLGPLLMQFQMFRPSLTPALVEVAVRGAFTVLREAHNTFFIKGHSHAQSREEAPQWHARLMRRIDGLETKTILRMVHALKLGQILDPSHFYAILALAVEDHSIVNRKAKPGSPLLVTPSAVTPEERLVRLLEIEATIEREGLQITDLAQEAGLPLYRISHARKRGVQPGLLRTLEEALPRTLEKRELYQTQLQERYRESRARQGAKIRALAAAKPRRSSKAESTGQWKRHLPTAFTDADETWIADFVKAIQRDRAYLEILMDSPVPQNHGPRGIEEWIRDRTNRYRGSLLAARFLSRLSLPLRNSLMMRDARSLIRRCHDKMKFPGGDRRTLFARTLQQIEERLRWRPGVRRSRLPLHAAA